MAHKVHTPVVQFRLNLLTRFAIALLQMRLNEMALAETNGPELVVTGSQNGIFRRGGGSDRHGLLFRFEPGTVDIEAEKVRAAGELS